MPEMLVESGEGLRVETLLSENSINGAGDKGLRGRAVLLSVSALGILLSDKEGLDSKVAMSHLLVSSISIITPVVTPWVGTVVVTVTLVEGVAGTEGDEDKMLSQLLLADPGSGSE